MSDCVANNPFRILGVYSNASAKDIAGNKSRIQAFLKVNRSVTFPLDSSISSPLVRTLPQMQTALAEINLPNDKIKYALFWFIKINAIDDMAIKHLAAGNEDKFLELLSKKNDFSSKINRAAYEMAEGDYDSAVEDITAVIHNDQERKAFTVAVCGDAYSITENELAHLYIDTLYNEYPGTDWHQIFIDYGHSSEDNNYISNKIIGKPISEINTEIAKAKATERDNAQANFKAGKQLILSTKANMTLLKEMLGMDNSQYIMIADRLALQILQNGINYFNNVDAADGIDEAIKMQTYAQRMAIGKIAKDRCNENVNILFQIKSKLPPISCRFHDKIIQKNIESALRDKSCTSAVQLIKSSFIYLQSIKAEVGASNSYYLHISTEVANVALGIVIDDYNNTFNKSLEIQLYIDHDRAMSKIKSTCKSALTAIRYIDRLDMEDGFKNGRYSSNKQTLERQASQVDIYVRPSTVRLDARNEDTIFSNAVSLPAIEEYKRLFPNGKFIPQCYAKIEKIEFEACQTTQDCENFKRKYPKSSLDIDYRWEDCFIRQCKTIQDYKAYLSNYPQGRHRSQAQNSIIKLEYDSCQSLHDYEAFVTKYPTCQFSPEAKQIIADERAWKQALLIDEKSAYKDYLSKFPNGRHKGIAQNKAGACYIATMVYGDYNSPEVIILRSFRDNVLRHHKCGQQFIAFYYKNSPTWVARMQGHKILNSLIRKLLNIFIKLYSR